MKASIRPLLPNLITFTSLICAFSALAATLEDKLVLAGMLIIAGYILDALDGSLARRLGVTSPFGVQLDSLVDMVIFGAGPSLLVYRYLRDLGVNPALIWGTCTAFLVGGAFRLARFNLLPEKQSHSESMGLTISTSGATLTLAVLANLAYDNRILPPIVFSLLAILLMALMASKIRYPALASILRNRWLSLISLGGIVALSILLTPQLVWLGITGSYVSFGLVRAVFRLA